MPMPLTTGQRVMPTRRTAEGPPPEEPGFLEGISASFDVAAADSTGYEQLAEMDAYRPLADALEDLGYDSDQLIARSPYSSAGGTWDRQKIYALVQREKAKGRFASLPGSLEEYEKSWRDKDRQRIEGREEVASRAGIAANLIGGIGGSFRDPLVVGSMFVGGFGSTVTKRIGTEILAGGVTEAALQPAINAQRTAMGRDQLTTEETLMNIASAGLAGGVLRGGFELAPGAARMLGENVAGDWQRTRDRIWPSLPQSVRDRFGSKEAMQPSDLPDVAEEVIGPDRMTQAERDAVDYARDEAELARTPFRPNGAGQQLHHDLIGEAMDALINMAPPATLPMRSPSGGNAEVRPTSRPGRVSGGNAFGDATAEAKFMGRVRSAESSGNDAARNPRSSATGRYQFIDSTWVRQYVKRYGRGGLTDGQILAKRGNGALQDQLMRDLTAENAAFLRSQGEAVTEGNLYLVHFGGAGGAKKVFKADPGTPIERVWSGDVVKANPFLRGMTAGDVISWAHRKMGQKGNPPRPGGGYELDDSASGLDGALAREAEELESIRRALDDAYAAEDAARRAAQGEEDSAAVLAALDAEPAPRTFDDAELEPFDEAASVPVEKLEPTETPEQAALRSGIAAVAHDSKDSLNDIGALARRFEATDEEVRAALDGMVARGTLTQNRKTGNYMRKPGSDPDELLETVARLGGLRDDEGNGLGLVDLSARERRELDSNAQRNTRRKRKGGGSRDWNKIMTRAGPLLRHEGRSVDAIGEGLWEAGWFTERPTTAQVLDLLESRIGKGEKMYPPGRDAPKEEAFDPAARTDIETSWEDAEAAFLSEFTLAKAFDDTLDDMPDASIMARAAEIYRDTGGELDAETAVIKALDEEYEQVLEDLAMQGMETDYGTRFDIFDPEWAARLDERIDQLRSADGAGGAGREGGPGNAGTRGESGQGPARDRADAVDPQRLAELTPQQRAPFSDPDGPATRQQADSLVHDMRAERDAALQAYRDEFDSPKTPEEAADLLGPEIDDPERAKWMEGWELGRAGGDSPKINTPLHDGWTVGNTTFGRQGPLDTPALDAGAQVDPAIAARQAEEARLRAEAPMRGGNVTGQEQDGTMGLGLFDAADQPEFLLDADGPGKTSADLLADLDSEAADLKNIRDCL